MNSSNKYIHPIYNSYIIKSFKKPFYFSKLNLGFNINNYNSIVNIIFSIFKNDFLVFFLYSSFFREELISFFRHIFGVKTSIRYKSLMENKLLKIKSYSWKSEMARFILKNDVRLFILLEIENSTSLVTFFKNAGGLVLGTTSVNTYYDSLDYCIFLDKEDFSTRYLLISLVLSLYNLSVFNKQIYNFQKYNIFFLKLLYNNYKFVI